MVHNFSTKLEVSLRLPFLRMDLNCKVEIRNDYITDIFLGDMAEKVSNIAYVYGFVNIFYLIQDIEYSYMGI